MYSYCLFCETIKCEEVAEHIRRKHGWQAIYPKIIQRKWVKGKACEESRTLLPGYVFVYTDDCIEHPRAAFRLDYVVRLLGDKDVNYALIADDEKFARMLYDCGGTIGILKAYQQGDRVRLAEGALGGVEGEIIKLDRRKGRAQIRYQFAGSTCTAWVGYDLIDGNDKVDLKSREAPAKGDPIDSGDAAREGQERTNHDERS